MTLYICWNKFLACWKCNDNSFGKDCSGTEHCIVMWTGSWDVTCNKNTQSQLMNVNQAKFWLLSVKCFDVCVIQKNMVLLTWCTECECALLLRAPLAGLRGLEAVCRMLVQTDASNRETDYEGMVINTTAMSQFLKQRFWAQKSLWRFSMTCLSFCIV